MNASDSSQLRRTYSYNTMHRLSTQPSRLSIPSNRVAEGLAVDLLEHIRFRETLGFLVLPPSFLL